MTARFRPVPDWIDDELENWSRWLAQGGIGPPRLIRLASAERDYIYEGNGHRDPDPPKQPVIVRRAEIVQRAYRWRLSDRERMVVNAEYPERQRSGREYGIERAAAWARVPHDEYQQILAMAASIIAREFSR